MLTVIYCVGELQRVLHESSFDNNVAEVDVEIRPDDRYSPELPPQQSLAPSSVSTAPVESGVSGAPTGASDRIKPSLVHAIVVVCVITLLLAATAVQ